MRGRGFRGSSYSRSSDPLPEDRRLNEGLVSSPLKTIPIPSPVAESVAIKDSQYIGSYNWIADEKTQTIIVPGAPAEWQNKATPYQVPADRGNYFSDQNGYRMPKAVLQPLITAVDIHHEEEGRTFDWSKVDIVTDRNGLRKLLRWIAGPGPHQEVKPFRIDLQLAGKKTVLFNRWEKRYREAMSGFTFGFNFEKASTVPGVDCENATGHHRIICYDLNGLKMVVRFEVDACIPTAAVRKSANIDELTDTLANVSIAQTQKSLPKSISHGLTILRGGQISPQSSMIELSTVSQRRRAEYNWKELYPQLFLSQTPHHFLAIHDRGRFLTIEKRRLETRTSTELVNAAKDLQVNLRKLRAALGKIQEMVKEEGERGRISLVCENGVLSVFERVGREGCLPDEFMARFE